MERVDLQISDKSKRLRNVEINKLSLNIWITSSNFRKISYLSLFTNVGNSSQYRYLLHDHFVCYPNGDQIMTSFNILGIYAHA